MDIIKFLKYELCGWKKYEVIALCIVFLIVGINAFVLHDSKAAIVSAVCGILYTTLAGKGKISCYFFGLLGTSFYSYLSFKNALWGNLLLYVCYYFPMQVTGIFKWKKHLKSDTKEIVKTKLSQKELIVLSLGAIAACVAVIFILWYFKDKSPIFDGITTVFSVIGMYLTVKRCIEQWIAWIIVNGLSSLMWLELVLKGAKAYSTLLMWIVYFILGIYFLIIWKNEMKETEKNNL